MTLADASTAPRLSRRDPTKSAGLRRHGRSVVNQRVFNLHQNLRQAVQENDIVGLKKPVFTTWVESNSQKMGRVEPMLKQMVDLTLSSPSDWLTETVTAAVERGVAQALKELSTPENAPDTSEVSAFHAAKTSNEVQGIGWETKRRLLGHVSVALSTRQQPAELMRFLRASLEKVTRRRLILLVNTAVVGALNAGKLLAYGSNGIDKVGIEPEWLPRTTKDSIVNKHGHRHLGIWRDEDLVNVLTAGDDDVCEDCADIAAEGPYSLDDAAGLIPAHPNCRCAFVPFGDRRYAQIEEQRAEENDE
jgi:hypothetical protein